METFADLELPDSQWADVHGPVHYREWPGPEGGPTFVCVHGLGGSLLNWAGVAPRLSRHGRVLALDLSGFGLTRPDGRGTGVGSNWKLLDGFIEALRLRPVILVGNSMGGMLSLVQCAHRPQTVRAMILVDAAFPRPRSMAGQFSPKVAGLFALYNAPGVGEWFTRQRAVRLGPERLVRETLRICTVDPDAVDPAMIAALVEQARKRQGFDYAARAFAVAARSIFRAQAFPGRYRALVRQARRPALVIHGEQDRLVPVASARVAAAEHPEWELVVLPGLGHIPQMEAPERWLQTVEPWLDRLVATVEEA